MATKDAENAVAGCIIFSALGLTFLIALLALLLSITAL